MSVEIQSNQRYTQPYYNIGLIQAMFPDGTMFQGSCSLVGRNDILTSTHVIYSPENGGWAEKLHFYFGADYNDSYGYFEDYGFFYSPESFIINAWPDLVFVDKNNDTMTQTEAQYDISIIGVSDAIGDELGWLSLNYGYDGSFLANAVGYPAGSPGMMQETAFVFETHFYSLYESYYDVFGPGSSGGPLLVGNDVIGVKSTGSWWADVGFVFDQLIDIMDENNSLLMTPPDTTPPTVSSFSPADAATGVATGSNILVTFSEVVQRGTGNIVLKSAVGATVATYDAATSANLSIFGDTLTINPISELEDGTHYMVEFAAGTIKDLAGNNYAGTISYEFTTVGATIAGTPQSDVLTGTMVADTISGAAGNDTINGLGGSDTIDGGTGVDTLVLNVSIADVLMYLDDLFFSPGRISQVGSSLGVVQLSGIERVQLNDGLYAFDTMGPGLDDPNGGKLWQVEALFQAAFGRLASSSELSQWTAQADQAADMGELGQRMIDFYAPVVSSENLVAYLYVMLTGTVATSEQVQGFVDQVGVGKRWSPSLGQVGGGFKVDRHDGHAASGSVGPT